MPRPTANKPAAKGHHIIIQAFQHFMQAPYSFRPALGTGYLGEQQYNDGKARHFHTHFHTLKFYLT
jgi:hypothetical protein